MVLGLPFGAATDDERRTQTASTADTTAPGARRHLRFRPGRRRERSTTSLITGCPSSCRLRPLNPVHEVAGAVRTAGTILRHRSYSRHIGASADPRRSCPHRLMLTASSSEPPASVGLACRPVGAWRRQLVKQLDSTRGGPGPGTFSSAVDSRPLRRAARCTPSIRTFGLTLSDPLPPSSHRAHDGGVCGSHKVEEGSGR